MWTRKSPTYPAYVDAQQVTSMFGPIVLYTCSICGSSVETTKREKHTEFHKGYVPVQEAVAMTKAHWCDVGDHAFKGGVPGSGSFTGTEYNEQGEPVQAQMDYCPDHSPQRQTRQARAIAQYERTGNPEDLTKVTDTVEDDFR